MSSTQFEIEEFDGSNITYSVSHEISRTVVIALAEDIVQEKILPFEERIDSKALPPLADYEQLLTKINKSQKRVDSFARKIHLSFLENPRGIVFVLKDSSNGKIVGCSDWILPSYVEPRFRSSTLHKIKLLFLRVYYSVLNFVQPKSSIRLIYDEYHQAATDLGIDIEDVDGRIAELKAKSPKEIREEAIYPIDYCYYLRSFGIRTDYHGLGLGKLLLSESINRLRADIVKPPMFDGPAKLLWQAAPMARGFYRKMGCTEGPTAVVSDLEHTAFYVNVD